MTVATESPCPRCKGAGETVEKREHRDMDIVQVCLYCWGIGVVEEFVA